MNFVKHSRGFTRQDFAKRNSGGFTLIEVITAVFVMTVGLVGVINVVQQIIDYNRLLSSRLIGAYLAQEGIEIVRNIRDTNWLEVDAWNDDLEAGDHEADYDDPSLSPFISDHFLRIDGGFYKYSLIGTPTPFKRKITIIPDGANKLKVTVEVNWGDWGESAKSIIVKENLYNWYYPSP